MSIGTNGPSIRPLSLRRLTADNRCAATQMSLSISCSSVPNLPRPKWGGIFLINQPVQFPAQRSTPSSRHKASCIDRGIGGVLNLPYQPGAETPAHKLFADSFLRPLLRFEFQLRRNVPGALPPP